MNRRRPILWLAISMACFLGAVYFWRLGDKWQVQKPGTVPATTVPNALTSQANPTHPNVRTEYKWTQKASTVPVAELKPLATNSPVVKRSNAFPYRLSNTTKTLNQLSRDNHAILLENALIDTASSSAFEIPDALKSHGDPGAYLVQADGPMNDTLRNQITAAGASIVSYFPNNTYLVTGSPAIAAELGGTFRVLPWEPYYKVKASLMRAALAGDAVSAANIAVFPGALEQTKASLDKMQVGVVSESQSPFGPVLALQNVRDIAAVASLPGVQIIEPSYPRIRANDLTRVIMSDSVDEFVPTNHLGLSGSNVVVVVADSFVPTNGATIFNLDLTNIIQDTNIFPIGFADLEGHGTHVAGIIGSSGVHSPTNAIGSQPGADFRGKAPASQIYPFANF